MALQEILTYLLGQKANVNKENSSQSLNNSRRSSGENIQQSMLFRATLQNAWQHEGSLDPEKSLCTHQALDPKP